MIDATQFYTILGLVGAAFAWLIFRMEVIGSRFERKFDGIHDDLTDIDKRLTVIETILHSKVFIDYYWLIFCHNFDYYYLSLHGMYVTNSNNQT